jgi:hypothetical protein
MPRLIVALNWTRRIPNDINYARFIADCLGKDPIFASPPLPLAVLESDIETLAAAHAYAKGGPHGAAAERNVWLAKVHGELMMMRSFVQALADNNPATGASIIESSGMYVKNSSGHGKEDFGATPGAAPGTLDLAARAARGRASYEWQLSLDGVNWLSKGTTVAAKTTLRDLPRATRLFVRYRVTTKDGTGDWSRVISLILQ